MELLLNELSLEGQYSSVENFVSTALTSTLKVLKELSSFGQLLLKKQDIYKSKITVHKTFHDVLKSPLPHQRDEIRKFKNAIVTLTTEPFWDETIKQDADSTYTWNNEDIWGSSLAESTARDRAVLSFLNSRFEDKKLEVLKDDGSIIINNICKRDDLTELLWSKGEILFGEYVINHFYNGKLNFGKMIDQDNFLNIEPMEQKLFLDTFRKFEILPWNQIIKDKGLNYKAFNNSLPGYSGSHSLDKFRASRLIRCHGYRKGDTFFVLLLEIDHNLSDNG